MILPLLLDRYIFKRLTKNTGTQQFRNQFGNLLQRIQQPDSYIATR